MDLQNTSAVMLCQLLRQVCLASLFCMGCSFSVLGLCSFLDYAEGGIALMPLGTSWLCLSAQTSKNLMEVVLGPSFDSSCLSKVLLLGRFALQYKQMSESRGFFRCRL